MHYYLIDFENVGVAGLTGLYLPGDDSEIRVFLSNAAHQANEEVMQDAIASKAVIDSFYCSVSGNNSMDFQIAAYAGALLERTDTTRISIISADQGYLSVIDYGRKVRKSIPIYLARSILEAYAAYQAGFAKREYGKGKKSVDFKQIIDEVKIRRQNDNEKIMELEEAFGRENSLKALRIWNANPVARSRYREMIRSFGMKDGVQIYRLCKELFVEGKEDGEYEE